MSGDTILTIHRRLGLIQDEVERLQAGYMRVNAARFRFFFSRSAQKRNRLLKRRLIFSKKIDF